MFDSEIDEKFMNILRNKAYCKPSSFPIAVTLLLGIVVGLTISIVINGNKKVIR